MLDQIIDEIEARRRPFPIHRPRPPVVLTGRALAALALTAFVQALRGLDAVDRGFILELLKVELVEMPPTA